MSEKNNSRIISQKEITLGATKDNLSEVMAFVEEQLEKVSCPMKAQMQISVAVEEIFINIASYAYKQGRGDATIKLEVLESPEEVLITFVDQGIPYDPLAKEDPDVTLSAEEREIGGLGIFMVKSTMDGMSYERRDGKNVLRLEKSINQ